MICYDSEGNVLFTSSHTMDNIYACTICYRIFNDINKCKKHYPDSCPIYCKVNFAHEKKVYSKDNIVIYLLTKKSYNYSYLKKAFSNILDLSTLENEWDFCPNKLFPNGIKLDFVIKYGGDVIGFISYRDIEIKEYELIVNLLLNIYIVGTYRKRGFGTLLFKETLKYLRLNKKEIIYYYPISEEFIKLLKKLKLRKIKVLRKNKIEFFDIIKKRIKSC